MKKINTLFLVDDDEIFQFLCSEVINSTQLVNEIKFFSNGSEAINYLEKVKDAPEELPEIIFLDLFMPVLDGWGFLEKFNAIKPKLSRNIVIYIISSSIDPADIQRAMSIADVSEFIIKPLTREKFINSLKEIMV